MKRIAKKLLKLVYLPPAILCVLLVRILKPLIIVRFCGLDIGRIGTLCPVDWYLTEKNDSKPQERYFDIFYFIKTTECISNRQWLKMWQRVIHVSPFWTLTQLVDRVNQRLPGFEAHLVPKRNLFPMFGREFKCSETVRSVLNNKKPWITFTPQEEILGEASLRKMGIPEGKRYISFHARDSVYLNKLYPQKDWSYHDHRDSDINNYLLAVEKLTQQGFFALRMGAVAEKKLESKNPMIIDYAMNGMRTDFLDVYLGAKCHLFLCSDTGISTIPELFRRPMVYVNWVPLLGLPFTFVLNGIVIPKKFYLRKERRFLSFKEIIQSEMGSVSEGKIFEELGIDLIENTPEEILSVTQEMQARLEGTWVTRPEDEKLQQDFWDLFAEYHLKTPGFHMGAEYLRQNKEFLYLPEKIKVGLK